jgi:GT2 family glycosyltransferase
VNPTKARRALPYTETSIQVGRGAASDAQANRKESSERAEIEHPAVTLDSVVELPDRKSRAGSAVTLTIFDEDFYLAKYPDIAAAVSNRQYASPYEHFLRHGVKEGRLPYAHQESPCRAKIDNASLFENFLLVTGWFEVPSASDAEAPTITFGRSSTSMAGSFWYSRKDVSDALSIPHDRKCGFVCLIQIDCKGQTAGSFELTAPGGIRINFIPDYAASSSKLLEDALALLLQGGNAHGLNALYDVKPQFIAAMQALYKRMVALTSPVREISRAAFANAAPRFSIIFVQCGTIPLLPHIIRKLRPFRELVEIILVNNSPLKNFYSLSLLTAAEVLHGFDWTYVEMPSNIGFGAACNIAAGKARGKFLLFHNNDVVPGASSDYGILLDVGSQRGLVAWGARQRFPSGALMHDGLRIGVLSPMLTGGRDSILSGISVGRGSPPAQLFGPIFASGSLLAVDRDTFMGVGGFSTDYLFGHFEDLDLGVRLRREGIVTHIIRKVTMYHAEGAGSEVPEVIAATVPRLNRLIFTLNWRNKIGKWRTQ